MHSKQIGNIAELAVAAELAKQGLPVFKEFGDLSRVDLITLIDDKAIKIQVKHGLKPSGNTGQSGCAITGSVMFKTTKSGPNRYQYKYTSGVVDIFAVYIAEINTVCFIPWSVIDNRNYVSVRYETAKNNQIGGTLWYADYLDIRKVLNGAIA